MRFIDFLVEADGQFGVVVSNRNGHFYDISFVDYNTLDSLTGHNKNVGERFIQYLRRHDAWQDALQFFDNNFPGKRLGEDYSDEDAEFILYGPLSYQQMNNLEDMFEEKYAYGV